MQEPSTLLLLKHGVQSSGLGVRQGPGSLAYPSCGRVGRPHSGRSLSLSGALFSVSAVLGQTKKFPGSAFVRTAVLKAPW